jgi:hypothetical protein
MSLPELTQTFTPNLSFQIPFQLTQSTSDVKIKPTEVDMCSTSNESLLSRLENEELTSLNDNNYY